MEVTTSVSRETERPVALDAKTACEALQATAAAHPDRPAIRTKEDEFTCTWAEYAGCVKAIAAGLDGLGVKKGDTVALMLANRPEFHFCDSAVMHLGATPFSIYNTYTAEQIEHLVTEAESEVVITEQSFVDKIIAARDAVDSLEHVVVVDGDPPQGAISLDELIDRAGEGFDFEAAWKAVEPDDVLTLIYTSGTTGPPKGVELTHASELAMLKALTQVVEPSPAGRCLSYLPAAHIADRWTAHYWPMLLGTSTTCIADPKAMPAVMKEVRPTIWGSVPRVWEKLRAALESAFGDEERRAVEVGRRVVQAEQAGRQIDDDLRADY